MYLYTYDLLSIIEKNVHKKIQVFNQIITEIKEKLRPQKQSFKSRIYKYIQMYSKCFAISIMFCFWWYANHHFDAFWPDVVSGKFRIP